MAPASSFEQRAHIGQGRLHTVHIPRAPDRIVFAPQPCDEKPEGVERLSQVVVGGCKETRLVFVGLG